MASLITQTNNHVDYTSFGSIVDFTSTEKSSVLISNPLKIHGCDKNKLSTSSFIVLFSAPWMDDKQVSSGEVFDLDN